MYTSFTRRSLQIGTLFNHISLLCSNLLVNDSSINIDYASLYPAVMTT